MTDPFIVHEKHLQIAWGDMDALGHVNNGKYFDYFQEARIEWLQNLHLTMNQEEGPVVIHVACTYLKPIVYPACIKLVSQIEHIGRTSLVMRHDVYQDDEKMAEGLSKVVWVDYTQNKSIPLPSVIKALASKALHKKESD